MFPSFGGLTSLLTSQRFPLRPQTLKENVDELDLGTQYHLSRYAYLLENVLVTEGLTIAPVAPEDGQCHDPLVSELPAAQPMADSFYTHARIQDRV